MRSLTPAQYNCVLELLDKRLSGHAISTTTGISVGSTSGIHSKHWSSIYKATGGHPRKLSPTDTSSEEVLWCFGAVCFGRGLDIRPRFMGGWMLIFLSAFWRMNSNKALNIKPKSQRMSSFSKTWPQTQEQKGPEVASREWITTHGVALSISWPKSNWTSLASPQHQTRRLWKATFWNCRAMGEGTKGMEWYSSFFLSKSSGE